MRLLVMAALTAGLGLAAMSGACAAPINATLIGKPTSAISPLATVQYNRYRHYYGHRYYRPYGYRPYYYRPYYYGYGPYFGYGPYYYRPYGGYPFSFYFYW